MIASMANRYWTFYRQTAYLMDTATATATMALDRAPSASSFIQVKVSGGTDGSGSVTITGTDGSGAAASESLLFSNNGSMVTVSRYATVTGLTTSGLTGESTVPNVSVKAVSADGTPNLIRYSVAASRPVLLIETGAPTFPAPTPGTYQKEQAKAAVDYEGATWTPREADIAIDDEDGTEWFIQGVREIRIGFGIRPDHYSMRCKLQGT
jgi:hypothetical protein